MVNHLVLLMGENPLPNYVVAKYLLSDSYEPEDRQLPKPDKIWIFHSEQTERGAQNLCELLQPDITRVERKKVTEYRKISSTCNALMSSVHPSADDTLHVNYTGGTKVMSVASALYGYLQISSLKKENIYLSYVAPDKHRINYRSLDQGLDGPDSVLPGGGQDLRCVSIGIDELAKLHGLTVKRKTAIPSTHGTHPDLAFGNTLAGIITSASRLFTDWSTFQKGYRENVKPAFEKKTGGKKQHPGGTLKTLDPIPISLEEDALKEGYRTFLSSKDCLNEDGALKFHDRLSDADALKIHNFLDGEWLEGLVGTRAAGNAGDLLTEKWLDVELKQSTKAKGMQIDVLLIRGYQPFFISCTTSRDEGLVKSKCFEVLHRARQIGGAEAKAVMVSFLHQELFPRKNDPFSNGQCSRFVEDLDSLEVKTSMFPIDDPDLLLIGLDDLKDMKFAKKIAQFVEKA